MKDQIQISKLVRSNRRTLSLLIDREGKLIVKAPQKMSGTDITSFIESKRNWIRAKQKDMLERKEFKKELDKKMEDKILFLGIFYDLEVVENYKYAFNFNQSKFIIDKKYLPFKKKLITLWYKQEAAKILPERVTLFANARGLVYSQVKISNAEKKWGSCSSRKSINLSWRLMLTPREIIDYIVIHELAHTVELNHSRKFWQVVASIDPYYKKHDDWINTNGYLLNF